MDRRRRPQRLNVLTVLLAGLALALTVGSHGPAAAGPYRVLFERDADGTANNDLAMVSYPTLTDLIDNTSSVTQFTAVDIDLNYSVGGITYDGSAYRVLFERDVDGTANNDLAVVSYPTLTDLIDNTFSVTQFTAVDIDPNYSVAGLDVDTEIGGGTGVTVAEPPSGAALLTGLAMLVFASRRRRT